MSSPQFCYQAPSQIHYEKAFEIHTEKTNKQSCPSSMFICLSSKLGEIQTNKPKHKNLELVPMLLPSLHVCFSYFFIVFNRKPLLSHCHILSSNHNLAFPCQPYFLFLPSYSIPYSSHPMSFLPPFFPPLSSLPPPSLFPASSCS